MDSVRRDTDRLREELLSDEDDAAAAVPAVLWASVLFQFSKCFRFSNTGHNRAAEMLTWMQDIALCRPEALEFVNRKELIENITTPTAQAKQAMGVSDSIVKSTLVALR